MKIRTSENEHFFQKILFKELNAFSLQGLLMDEKYQFTAAVEAIEFEHGERIKNPFNNYELTARYVLANNINVPFYIIYFLDDKYHVVKVVDPNDTDLLSKPLLILNEESFIQWWSDLKKTTQSKRLYNGGESRINDTIFDRVLRKYGLEWGGNIDGFVLNENNTAVKFIIDNISVSKQNLADDPANYFNSSNPKHGPRYKGWYASVKLSNQLKVPHLLFTIDKRNEKIEHIGLTAISRLAPSGIYYVNDIKPNNNIFNGKASIKAEINRLLLVAKPPLLE